MKRRWKGRFMKLSKHSRIEGFVGIRYSTSKYVEECLCDKPDALEGDSFENPPEDDSHENPPEDQHDQESNESCETMERWRVGRRLIELGHLADQLKKCKNQDCYRPIHLHNTVHETQIGFASILYIMCSCGMRNAITTGKSHRPPDKSRKGMPVFDINTKSTLGVIHNGLIYRQMKGLMSTLEVNGLNHTGMMRRREEINPIILDVAQDSCLNALTEEADLAAMRNGSDLQPDYNTPSKDTAGCSTLSTDNYCSPTPKQQESVFKYDMGWQKRGSGCKYDSKSGVGTLIGNESGKVCAFGVRQSDCRLCSSAKKKRQVPNHTCAKNWSGSAKAMEPDVGIEVVKSVEDKGVKVSTLIMDDDTTTMARIRKDLTHDVIKWSDVKHTSKHLSNSLYKLQSKHKCLSNGVIAYLKKCFNYALAQTKLDAEKCKNQIEQIVPHSFGEHSKCGDWCGYTNNPDQYRHQTLIKDLTGDELRTDLNSVFNVFSQNAEKIAPGGSTKDVESFHNMVATKAPKRCHFSASSNLMSRVGCAIAQKNLGHDYITVINEKVGLSPGRIWTAEALRRDTERKRQKQYVNQRETKLKKMQNKLKKRLDLCAKEKREGTTYKSAVATISDNLDVEIPPQVYAPKKETLSAAEQLVFCDIETGSLNRDCDILQLAACANGKTFNHYIMPSKPVSSLSTKVTGLTAQGGVLFHEGSPVVSLPMKYVLQMFIDWLTGFGGQVVLVGHNIKIFDFPRIIRAVKIVGLQDEFQKLCAGVVDTLPLFKEIYTDKDKYPKHSQTFLVEVVLKETYSAHDALPDVLSLEKLFNATPATLEQVLRHSFTTVWGYEDHSYQEQSQCNKQTLCELVKDEVISKHIAKKIAGSGLQYHHLAAVYRQGGDAALRHLLSERKCELPRVTGTQQVIDKIINYFKTKDNRSN